MPTTRSYLSTSGSTGKGNKWHILNRYNIFATLSSHFVTVIKSYPALWPALTRCEVRRDAAFSALDCSDRRRSANATEPIVSYWTHMADCVWLIVSGCEKCLQSLKQSNILPLAMVLMDDCCRIVPISWSVKKERT